MALNLKHYIDILRLLVKFCFLNYYPLNAGRKLNVHKMFRRRPGRLLNVLCTFNLDSDNIKILQRNCGYHNQNIYNRD